jgi:O-antigen ligase
MGLSRDDSDCAAKELGILWPLLLLAAVVHVPLKLPGVSTQIAAFDLLLPAIFARAVWQKQIEIPSKISIVAVVVVLASILLHSTGVFLLKEEFQLAWLIKETLKAEALTIEFIILLTLFGRRNTALPTIHSIGSVLGFSLIAVGVLAYQMLGDEPFFFARTVYCVALSGLLFLAAADAEWLTSRGRRFLILIAAVAVAGVAALSLSKAIAGLTLAMGAWMLFAPMVRGSLTSRMGCILAVLAGVMVFGISMVKFAGTSFELLHRMDSIERSISVRLDLWGLGIEAFWRNFPWGVGLGQFWQVVGTDVTLAGEGHRYAHSSFLSLPIELGLLGLLLSIGLFILMWTANRGWPWMVQPLFVLLVFVPLAIHDGHSIRMLLIVTALGLARFLAHRRGKLNGTTPPPPALPSQSAPHRT